MTCADFHKISHNSLNHESFLTCRKFNISTFAKEIHLDKTYHFPMLLNVFMESSTPSGNWGWKNKNLWRVFWWRIYSCLSILIWKYAKSGGIVTTLFLDSRHGWYINLICTFIPLISSNDVVVLCLKYVCTEFSMK